MNLSIIDTFPKALRAKARAILTQRNTSELELTSQLCRLFSPAYPILDVLPSQIDINLLNKYTIEKCRELNFLPISKCDMFLTGISPTPWDMHKLSQIRSLEYDSVRLLTVTDSTFSNLLAYAASLIEAPRTKGAAEVFTPEPLPWQDGALNAVKTMFRNAFKMGASDIHIEPQEQKVVVKFRINGELVVQEPVHRLYKKGFIDAIKDLAALPLNETKNLADCRFSLQVDESRVIDFRVAKLPISGEYENFVFRLLDSQKLLSSRGKLPFTGSLLTDFTSALDAESGMIILTGPTGSGKTTTLYSALTRLDLASLNVRTIEDPIEYRLPKAVQTQIDVKNGVTWARALRSMLRADPDVIMVGEIRDAETAELAVGAANTGHLVLTTLHTRSAVGVIPRLRDLGLSNSTIQEACTLVVSQRLLPKLCPKCKTHQQLTDAQKRHFEARGITPPHYVYTPLGCPDCNNTGIAGRVPVFEFLKFDTEMKNLILTNPTLEAIEEINFKRYNPLVKEVLLAIARGDVAYNEVRNYETRMNEFV